VQTSAGTRDGVAAESDLISFLLWRPLLLLLNTLAFPKSLLVLSKVPNHQNIHGPKRRVERTWRFSCRARDRVIGPFIVCIEMMSSSAWICQLYDLEYCLSSHTLKWPVGVVFIATNHLVAVEEGCWRWAHRPRHPTVRVRSRSTIGGFVLMGHRTVRCRTG
jgi:hypothetical protein